MNINVAYTKFASLSLALALSACATSPNSPSLHAQQSQVSAEVPALLVKVDCGSCSVRQNVPQLIQDGYNSAASEAGVRVAQDKTVEITIKEYAERSDTARIMAGALAGKDEIKANITYQGKDISVEDYYRNAWQGIESLAKKIGEMTFNKIKS